MHRLAFLVVLLLPLPAPAGSQDAWSIDQRASTLSFSASQIGAIVSGRFPTWTAQIVLDPANLAAARIEVVIDTPSVTANNRDVDSLLRGPSFLAVQKFPQARFVSTAIVARGGDRYEARGRLTIRDVTREVVLPFTLAITDNAARPGLLAARARGRVMLKRLDFGVGQSEWASTGQVADEVTVDLDVVAARSR